MKVLVEIHDAQVVAVLQDAMRTCFSTSIPRQTPPRSFEVQNMIAAAEFCTAANKVIDHFGGEQVDVTKIEPYPAFSLHNGGKAQP